MALTYPEHEPMCNTYQITLTVTDVSRSTAVRIANEVADMAREKPTKSRGLRLHNDVKVTVAHVKVASE